MAMMRYTREWTGEYGKSILPISPASEAFARDPGIDPAMLRSLATGSCAPLVAANPNTPEDVIWRLAEWYPAQVCQNPVLPFLLIADPNCATDPYLLEILARCDDCPALLQQRFKTMDQPTFGQLLNTWHDRVTGKKETRFFGERSVYQHIGNACHNGTFGTRQLAWRAQIVTGLENPVRFIGHLSGYPRNDRTGDYKGGMRIGADRVLAVLERMGCMQYTLFNMWEEQ